VKPLPLSIPLPCELTTYSDRSTLRSPITRTPTHSPDVADRKSKRTLVRRAKTRKASRSQPRGRSPKGHPRALYTQSPEDRLVDRRVHDVPVGGAVWRGREAQDPAAHARQHRRTARGCGGHGARRRRSARARSAGSAHAIRRPQKSRTCALVCYTACYTRRGFQRNPRRCAVEAPGVEPDGQKTKNIKGCAGLHNNRADLDALEMSRDGSLGSG
jgi:hypothetical protein